MNQSRGKLNTGDSRRLNPQVCQLAVPLETPRSYAVCLFSCSYRGGNVRQARIYIHVCHTPSCPPPLCVFNKVKGDVSVPCPEMQDSANAKEVYNLKGVVEAIGRQIVVSEMSKEQRVRYEGASGLTQTRGYQGGDKAYHEASYTNVGFANFHNHANTKHTVGMGEVAVVLNGVEFWTRHNDYNLVMPDPADPGTYHSNKYITHPPVPPAVEVYESINDQAEEMRRWFHAWQDEDPKCPSCVALDDAREEAGQARFDDPNVERYYPEYFKPVLCVMEGAWLKQSLDFEESFESDRHFVDAKDWRELYDKNRFLYQSGQYTFTPIHQCLQA